jgi:RNA polymerase sigma-70 factor (ECF subfamily)
MGGEERKEANLIPAVVSGAAAAQPAMPPPVEWEQIFRANYARIFRAAYRVTGSTADAEDVLQTVFLRVIRREEEVAVGNLEGYLHRSAVNAALDLVRSRKLWHSVPLEDTAPLHSQDPSSDPDRTHASREARAILRKAVAALAPRAAEIFALRYFEGCDNIDIARMLGISQTQVAVSLHRTRSRLQQEIRNYMGDHQ